MSKLGQLNVLIKCELWDEVDVLLKERPELLTKKNTSGQSVVDFACEDSRWKSLLKLVSYGLNINEFLPKVFQRSAPLDIVLTLFDLNENQSHETLGLCLAHAYEKSRLDLINVIESHLEDHVVFSSEVWKKNASNMEPQFIDHLIASRYFNKPNKEEIVKIAEQAILRRNIYLLTQLKKMGLNENSILSSGFTLLGFAVKIKNIEAVHFLLELKVEIDKKDNDGHSALYFAVANGDGFIVDLLLDCGASPDLRQGKRNQGDSPLRLATKALTTTSRIKLIPALEEAVFKKLIKISSNGQAIKKRL